MKLNLFLILLAIFSANTFAKKTAEERQAARDKRKAEREAKKNSYGIDKSNSNKWKCKKGKGSQSKADCKSSLSSECSGKTGYQMKGSSCKKVKGYLVKSSNKSIKCKKSYDSTDTKEQCIEKVKAECSSKGEGWSFKGSKCKFKKPKKFEIVTKGNKLKCAKAKSTSGTLYDSKDDCKNALEASCESKKAEGFSMKGSSCKKAKVKLFEIKTTDTKMACKKAKNKKETDPGVFKSKDDCKNALEASCESKKAEGFSMKGSSCKKAKEKLFEIKTASSGVMKCSRSGKNSTAATKYKSKEECATALKTACDAKAANGFSIRGKKCTNKGGKASAFFSGIGDKLGEAGTAAVDFAKDNAAAGVGLVKTQINNSKLKKCQASLKNIKKVNITVFNKDEEGEPVEFKQLSLVKNELNPSITPEGLASAKESGEPGMDLPNYTSKAIPGCETGCKVRVDSYETGAPNNSCDHITSGE